MEDVLVKEQAPVVFDASLNFVLGCERQRVKQCFRPTASHLEPSTASSYLSSKISQFLKRTDHVMDEWRSLGHRDETDDEPISLPYARERNRGVLGRSQSATNIMIRGYQYYSRSNSVAKSPSRRSLSRASEDATLSDGMQEVTRCC
jgi:myosin-18